MKRKCGTASKKINFLSLLFYFSSFRSSANAISNTYTRWNTGPHVMLIPDPGAGGETPKMNSLPGITASGASDGVPSDNTEDEWSRGSGTYDFGLSKMTQIFLRQQKTPHQLFFV